MNYFEKVKKYLLEIECEIIYEDPAEELFLVNKEEVGIQNMVVDCEDPILLIEQALFEIQTESIDLYKSLLKKNREIVHGAFVLDDQGQKVIFRDTLQLENLDKNELESSIASLSLLLAEYCDEILTFSK